MFKKIQKKIKFHLAVQKDMIWAYRIKKSKGAKFYNWSEATFKKEVASSQKAALLYLFKRGWR